MPSGFWTTSAWSFWGRAVEAREGQQQFPGAEDIDVSVMAAPCSKGKEGMVWTYKGVNGFSPVFACLGTDGYALAAEMRPGTQHCSKGTQGFVEYCIALAVWLGFLKEELPLRLDSGHDDRGGACWRCGEGACTSSSSATSAGRIRRRSKGS